MSGNSNVSDRTPNTPPRGRSRNRKLATALVVVGGLFLVIAVLLISRFRNRGDEAENPATRPVAVDVETAGTRRASLDEALQIAREGLARMDAELIDYRGTLTKRERVGGTLVPENRISFKIRTQREANDADPNDAGPARSMAVYLKFEAPASTAGREVIWVADRNAGKLVAHEPGMLGLIPVPPLDPNGFLAMQGNRYPITQIGFKNLVRQLLERGSWIERSGGAEVTFVESYLVGDRDCRLIQVRPKVFANGTESKEQSADPRIDFTLAEIAIDKQRQLPLRYAAYGIPANLGEPPPLLEEYTYTNVETNVGLTDLDFDPTNEAYQFP